MSEELFFSDEEIATDPKAYQKGLYLYFNSNIYYIVRYDTINKGYICRG